MRHESSPPAFHSIPSRSLGIYIADFYCAEKQLVIALDGDTHYTAQGESYDRTRTTVLALSRIRVLRFTNADVMNEFDAVCMRIDEALSAPASIESQTKI
jgi:very-short-patch-repair endonuclease